MKASPLARKIAREHGLDLRGVAGTGPGGRIVEKDVEQALGGKRSPEAQREAPSRPVAVPAGGRVELSRIRRTTAKRMGEAKREIPYHARDTVSRPLTRAVGYNLEKLTQSAPDS